MLEGSYADGQSGGQGALTPADFCRALLERLDLALADQPTEVLRAARELLERHLASRPDVLAFENGLAREVLCGPLGPVPQAATLIYNLWQQERAGPQS